MKIHRVNFTTLVGKEVEEQNTMKQYEGNER